MASTGFACAISIVKRILDDCHLLNTLKHMLNQSARLDQFFSALSDPSRRAIIERLGTGPASVSELAKPLEMTLAAVVQHVQRLAECGLIQSDKKGRIRMCRLNAQGLDAARKWIVHRQEAFWKAGLEAVENVLQQEHSKSQRKGRKQ